ncbi:MAG: sialidase family protein, partial [Candidatus Poribacteria bacterium]
MSNVPMTRPEEALAIHETNYFHSSTFVELSDGRILHAAGATFTTSDDGGVTWSEPFQRRDANGARVGGGGTSVVNLSGEGIGLAAMWRNPEDSRRNSHLLFWRSEDAGETWEPPVRVTPPGMGVHAYQDVLLRTSSGRIILPVYISLGQSTGPDDVKPPASGKLVNGQWVSTAAHFFDPHFSCSYVCYSDDDGRTWQRNKDGEL